MSKKGLIEEKLVLKKKVLDDGNIIFILDSDLEGAAAGKETYTNKDKISGSKLFHWDKTNLRKWVSKKYSPEEFSQQIPVYKTFLAALNREQSFDALADDLEEMIDQGLTDKISSFLEELKEKIKTDASSEDVKQFLAFREKFHRYSFNNQILIFLQKKSATSVAGKKKWLTMNRKIKEGAKGIYIFVPFKSKYAEPEPDSTDTTVTSKSEMTRFILKPVFDISDTEVIEGKEDLAKKPDVKWYDENIIDEQTRYLYDALLEFAKTKNIKVSIVDTEELGSARGASFVGKIQLVRENISTLIHEIAHEILHDREMRANKNVPSKFLELQAEGVAYLVLREFGLPHEHTSKYLAIWRIEPDNIRENEYSIRSAATEIINYVKDYIAGETSSVKESTSFINFFPRFLNKKSLLAEADWNLFSDVKYTCLTTEQFVKILNKEYERFQIVGHKRPERKKSNPIMISSQFKFDVNGEKMDIEHFKNKLIKIPSTIFGINEKMKHSETEEVLVINTGFAALRAFYWDENTGGFKIINTCPFAGKCAENCFALHGNFIRCPNKVWLNAQRVQLLLSDPERYEKIALKNAVAYAAQADFEDKRLDIRWNDSGDFFTKVYLDMAIRITQKLNDRGFNVRSYMYTKSSEIASMEIPNFIISFSQGAAQKEERIVEQNPEKYKIAVVVPEELWKHLFHKKGPIFVRNEDGKPVFVDENKGREELRKIVYNSYKDTSVGKGVTKDSLKFTDELPKTPSPEKYKYNVIVLPYGDSDVGAQRTDVKNSYLLEH